MVVGDHLDAVEGMHCGLEMALLSALILLHITKIKVAAMNKIISLYHI